MCSSVISKMLEYFSNRGSRYQQTSIHRDSISSSTRCAWCSNFMYQAPYLTYYCMLLQPREIDTLSLSRDDERHGHESPTKAEFHSCCSFSFAKLREPVVVVAQRVVCEQVIIEAQVLFYVSQVRSRAKFCRHDWGAIVCEDLDWRRNPLEPNIKLKAYLHIHTHAYAPAYMHAHACMHSCMHTYTLENMLLNLLQ